MDVYYINNSFSREYSASEGCKSCYFSVKII